MSTSMRAPSLRLASRPAVLHTPSSGGRSSPLRQSWKTDIKNERDEPNYASGSGTSSYDLERKPMVSKAELEEHDAGFYDIAMEDAKSSLSSGNSTGELAFPLPRNPPLDASESMKLERPSISTIGSARRRTMSEKENLANRRAFIRHLPRAEKEALDTFTVLQENLFQNKSMGRSGQTEDSMFCDCSYNPNSDEPHLACGLHSNCINRLTQVECLHDQCQTQGYCRNQRFSRREYSDVQVVKTEKKGYGLRAGADIETEAFIYEYIGEVVTQPSLEKRMEGYAKEGIPHFYFMMLQKEEYLDATKKGGIARFANHSCNPNCHVQKWVVGKRVRMGIFALRDIEEGEELTFNYNVDRYGHAAQTCYCEEPNCVGTIGGKTQTDIGGMDELYIEALGIADEVAALEAKGTKRKKGRKLDEDFNPTLCPLSENEVPKVAAALRQGTENRRMVLKLLDRVQMTTDQDTQNALMRMHGFNLFTQLLTQFSADQEVTRPILTAMAVWRPAVRNKVEDSKIEEQLRNCLRTSDSDVASIAQGLLDSWAGLDTVWRIPRKVHMADMEDDVAAGLVTDTREVPAAEAVGYTASWATPPASTFQLTQVAPIVRGKELPRPPPTPRPAMAFTGVAAFVDRSRLESILALAKINQAEALAAPPPLVHEAQRKRDRGKDSTTPERHKKPRGDTDEKRAKRLTKVVGEFVVRTMSKYKDQMERETFKRYAKECTQVLTDKEKKGKSWQQGDQYETLSDEKKAKMKIFIKEFAHKILKKLKDKGKLLTPQLAGRRVPSDDNIPTMHPRSIPGDSFDEDAQLLQDMFGPDLGDDDLDEDDARTGSSRDRMEETVETPELASPEEKAEVAISSHTPNTPPSPPEQREKRFIPY